MGKILQLSLALMFTFFVVGLFMNAMYYGSDDANKTVFTRYGQYDNNTGDILTEGNVTYQNTNSTLGNFQRIGEELQTAISEADRDLRSGTLEGTISGAFGLVTSVAMNAFFVILAVIIEGVNFVGGVGANLMTLPAPYQVLTMFISLGTTAIFIYLIFKLISAYKGWDI